MNQILFYSKILLLLFIGTNCIFPKDYKPLNKPKQFTLTISDRDRVYYELDKSSPLEFNKIGRIYIKPDSFEVIISARIRVENNRSKKFKFAIQIGDNDPDTLEFNKSKDPFCNQNRPGFQFTTKGEKYIYLNQKDTFIGGYNIKIIPIKNSPPIYIRLRSHKVKRTNNFSLIKHSINVEERIKIGYNKNNFSDTLYSNWFLVNASKNLQFRIKGPKTIRIKSRLIFSEQINNNFLLIKEDGIDPEQINNYFLLIKEDGIDLGTYYFTTAVSEESFIEDSNDDIGKWRSIWLNIPEGIHIYTFSLPDIEKNHSSRILLQLKEWQED